MHSRENGFRYGRSHYDLMPPPPTLSPPLFAFSHGQRAWVPIAHGAYVRLRRLCPNVGVNDDRLGSSVVMLGDGSDGFVAGDCGGVGVS